MVRRHPCGKSGFSLIELSIVIVASGLLMAAGFSAYHQYMKDRYARESYDKLKSVESSLALYASFSKRLPCPSNPTIPLSDQGSGLEIPAASCAELRDPATPAGTCRDGVCKTVTVGRDADGDGSDDAVLIGGLPYAAIRQGSDPVSTTYRSMTLNYAIDPWDYQLTYAVSALLTNQPTYLSSHGAINIQTEDGISLVDPPNSALYALIAHGDNHMGAYTSDGFIGVPCVAGATADAENCDGDSTFVIGLRSLGAGANYFDDVVVYNAFTVSILWDFVGSTSDIYNRNPGFVGIGTEEPTQRLEVRSTGVDHGNIKATTAIAANLCGKNNQDCWSPDLLAAPKASGLALGCPDTATPGMIDVVIGVTLWDHDANPATPDVPRANCGLVPMVAPSLAQSCAGANEYVLGFDAAGNIECGAPPPP